MKKIIRIAVVAALVASSVAHAADLAVEVAGLTDAKGRVLVAVYDRADGFLKRPVRTAVVDAHQGSVRLVIAHLSPGDYGLSVFQDKNSNGDLDTNPVGMPLEPYGFSNDAMGGFGPPSFEQALVHLPEAGASLTINLR